MRRLLDEELDWDDVMRRVIRHGVPTLLYHHLRGLGCQEAAPPQVWAALELAYRGAHLAAMRQGSACTKLLEGLQEAEVEAIPLKGLALREGIYPDPGLRLSGDVDLLVQQADVETAEEVLEGLGYVPSEAHGPRERFKPTVSQHTVPLRLPGRNVQIDVHWNLLPTEAAVQVNVEGLWQRAVPGYLAGRAVRFLASEDFLLHLALHTSLLSRFQTGFRHLVDIAEMASTHEACIDWQQLIKRADHWRAKPYVYVTLRVTRDLLGLVCPNHVLTALRPVEFDDTVCAAARRRILGLGSAETKVPIPRNAAKFLLMDSADERIRLLSRAFFPPPERMADMHDLPPDAAKLLIHYPLRWFELARRYARLALGLVRRDNATLAVVKTSKCELLLDQWLSAGRHPEAKSRG
jgi:hypothetical protein